MAVLDRGILGGGRNAVGTVVMSKWRGKDIVLVTAAETCAAYAAGGLGGAPVALPGGVLV